MNETWWVNSSQLDDDQREILRADSSESLLIKGPPGSGKTNILLLRANYIRKLAPRVLFLTFTRTLREFISSSPNINRADQIQPCEINTFMGWGKSFAREFKVVYKEPSGGFVAQRNALLKALSEFVENCRPGIVYDAIFIDEVQDLKGEELKLLQSLSHTLHAAGDSRQAIWNNSEGLEVFQKMAEKTVELQKHYRIGPAICTYADRILPPPAGAPHMIDGCAYDDDARPSLVSIFPAGDYAAQFAKIFEELERQIRYIADEPILVLAHRAKLRDKFWGALQSRPALMSKAMIQSADEGYEPFGPDSLIRVMTIHSAKGSEARAVHILAAERLTVHLRELAFTAVTRAKTEVSLYHDGALPGHLMLPVDKPPEVDELF